MSVALDTSVTLRLLTGVPAHQAELARNVVAAASTAVLISDLVVSETYFALRHHYDVPHLEAVKALQSLLSDARVQSTGVGRTVLAELSTSGSKFRVGLMDRLIRADYARDAGELVTFERELGKLPGVRLLSTT